MAGPDPSSLQNLHDIVLPAAPALWPPAPGWYVVAALLTFILGYLARRSLYRWLDNRYRRQALAALSADPGNCHTLLKRSALSVYPREQVAALSGEPWWAFLNNCCEEAVFSPATIALFEAALYRGATLESAQLQQLQLASRRWILQHRKPEAD